MIAVRFNNQDVVNIKVDYNKEGAFHTFIIQDNGIGIDPKYHDQVFSMFKRLNNRVDFSGSGLGLSVAQKLAKKMGGEISILRSDVNEGADFQVKFKDNNIY